MKKIILLTPFICFLLASMSVDANQFAVCEMSRLNGTFGYCYKQKTDGGLVELKATSAGQMYALGWSLVTTLITKWDMERDSRAEHFSTKQANFYFERK